MLFFYNYRSDSCISSVFDPVLGSVSRRSSKKGSPGNWIDPRDITINREICNSYFIGAVSLNKQMLMSEVDECEEMETGNIFRSTKRYCKSYLSVKTWDVGKMIEFTHTKIFVFSHLDSVLRTLPNTTKIPHEVYSLLPSILELNPLRIFGKSYPA